MSADGALAGDDKTLISLRGTSVIVTGAGKGLGEAYAVACAERGAGVVVTDIDGEAADEVVADIVERGGRAIAIRADVADSDEADAVVERCRAEFGGVSALINNAGIYHVKPIWEETLAGLRAMLEVNVVGTFNMSRAAVNVMRQQQSGSIVNVTSGAQTGIWGSSAYAATKGAAASMTYTLAMELAPFNVRVNAISPNGRSNSSVRKHLGWDAATNAPVVVFLASDASATVTGQVIRIEGPTVSLVRHPRPGHRVVADEGWSPERVANAFATTFHTRLEPVGLGQTDYAYHAGLTSAPPPHDIRDSGGRSS